MPWAYVRARTCPAAGPVGVGELAAQGDLAGAAIHRHVGELQRALALVGRPFDAQGQRLAVAGGQGAFLQGVAQAQGLGRGLGEIRIDRIELLDARHQRRLALPDQRALGHQRAADAPEIGAVTEA